MTLISYPNLTAIIALGISFLSIGIGFYGLLLQRIHNRLSVRPIGHIILSDYVNKIAITIKNAGMGTMILKSFETTDKDGNKKRHPIEWMPKSIVWSDFRRGLPAIKEGDSIVYLEYRLDPKNINSVNEREMIRSILKNLTIKITYTDIYGKEQKPIIKNLENIYGRIRMIPDDVI